MLIGDEVYPLSKWILYIFSPTRNNSGQSLSAQEEYRNKNLFSATLESVFGIVKLRRRRYLLKMLHAYVENVLN